MPQPQQDDQAGHLILPDGYEAKVDSPTQESDAPVALDKELDLMNRVVKETGDFESSDRNLQLLTAAIGGKQLGVAEVVGLKLAVDMMASDGQGRSSEWMDVGSPTDQGLTRGQRLEMYKRARKFVRVEPLAGNLQRLMMTHVAGRGFYVGLKPQKNGDPHTLQPRFEAYFGENNDRRLRFFRQIIAHTIINGSTYAVNFPMRGAVGKLGRPGCKILLPDYLADVNVGDGFAINSTTEDYRFPPLTEQAIKEGLTDGWIPKDAVTEFHILKDFNDGKHGLSFYIWLLKTFPRYIDFLDLRANAMRAEQFMLFIRSLKGIEGGAFREIPLRSGILDVNAEQEDYNLLQANSKARDATADGDEVRSRMTQSQPFSEPVLTGNPKYGAQVAALGFPGPVMEMFQDEFTVSLQELVAKRTGCREEDVLVSWPFTDRAERAKIVTELNAMRASKDISRKAMHRRLGYNAELIAAELLGEKQQELTDAATLLPGAAAPAPPAASPLGRTVMPAMPSIPLAGAPVEPSVEFNIPESLATASITIPFETIAEGTIKGEMIAGIDAGFKEGAIVLGGTDGTDILVIGSVEVFDLPKEGETSWRSTLEKLQELFPRLRTVYVSADDPELVEMMKTLDLEVHVMQIGDDDATAELETYIESGGVIHISEQADRLISALQPGERDAAAGTHLKEESHAREAFKYLAIGHLRGKSDGNEGDA